MSNGSTWTPGYRRVPPSKKIVAKAGGHMLALAQVKQITLRLLKNVRENDGEIADDTPDEPGDNILLSLQTPHRKLAIDLSSMTVEEILTLKKMFDLALQVASPIVVDRDRVALEAAQNGDDLFYRRLRPAPTFSVFQRQIGPYLKGVPHGRQDVLGGDGPREGEPVGPGGAGSDLAQPATASNGDQDNSASADQHQEPGPVV